MRQGGWMPIASTLRPDVRDYRPLRPLPHLRMSSLSMVRLKFGD